MGNAKGAVAVVVSILLFKNPISMMGMMGYVLTVIGVILYTEAKKRYHNIVSPSLSEERLPINQKSRGPSTFAICAPTHHFF